MKEIQNTMDTKRFTKKVNEKRKNKQMVIAYANSIHCITAIFSDVRGQ